MNATRTSAAFGLLLLAGASAHAWDLKLSENHTLQFHGFLSQGYLNSSDYNYLGDTQDGGSFQFNEAGINLNYSPFQRTRIMAQGFTYDIGKVGNYQAILDYASIEYTVNDNFGVRAGRVRRPGGIYNHIQDVDLARTSILLPQGIYDARWRDFRTSVDGLLFFGSFDLGKAGSLSYELFGGLARLSDRGGIATSTKNSGTAALRDIDDCTMFGSQTWWNTPVNGLRFGVSYGYILDFTTHSTVIATGQERVGESKIPFGTLSGEYVWDKWTFQAEYYSNRSIGKTYNETTGALLAETTSHPAAWYFGVSRRINDWFEVGTYYSEYFGDWRNKNGNNDAPTAYQKDFALSLRFDPTDWWIFKLEGHVIHGTAQLQDAIGNVANPASNQPWYLLAAKTTFSF